MISSDNLLIKANGNVTFTGPRIFINNANNVTLSGLNFVNCTDTIIWNNNGINLYNLTFYNNVAEDATCVESWRDATLSVDCCTFIKNFSQGMDAGGISNRGHGSITNCVFIENYAYRDGGAVRNHGGILTIQNSTFINNSAFGNYDDSFGGAVYMWIGSIEISDCLFLNNYAPDYGGAVHICKGRMESAYAQVSIHNNIFINNSAKCGGAILLEGCEGAVFNNVFVNNTENTVFLSDFFIQYFNTTINDNWWGENSPDWNTTLINLEVPSSIVTLNLTVDPTELNVNESAVCTYDFYVGDAKANIPKRSIALSASGGNLVNSTFFSSSIGNFTISASADNEVVEVDVTVKDNPFILTVEDVEKYFSGNESLIITLTDRELKPISNATVAISINGKTYSRTTNENGTASMAINLNSGVYDVTTTFDSCTVESKVYVKSTVNGSDIVKIYKNQTQYQATFLDAAGSYLASGTVVTFNINGVFYERAVRDNGIARLNINLEQGNYVLTAINPKTGENAANNVTVLASITNNTDLVKYYRNDSQYEVTVLGADGNPVGAGESVTFNINGVFYNRTTNSNGVARLNINLQPGDYIITAEYNGCRVSNNITVLGVLYAKDLVKKYGDSSKFKVSLVDGVGNPYAGQNVTFNINGVFYTHLTNEVGVAHLDINLQPGEYIITSSYNGSNIANTVKVEEI